MLMRQQHMKGTRIMERELAEVEKKKGLEATIRPRPSGAV